MKSEAKWIKLIIGADKPQAFARQVDNQAQLDELVNGFNNMAKDAIKARTPDDATAMDCVLLHNGAMCFNSRQLPATATAGLIKYFKEWQPAAAVAEKKLD